MYTVITRVCYLVDIFTEPPVCTVSTLLRSDGWMIRELDRILQDSIVA